MRCRAALVLLVLSLAACEQRRDDAPLQGAFIRTGPRTSFVEVAPGVRLEVLEWSPNGLPLVLLAGATQTAHVYQDFAPYFTDRFRVIGITRRRHGASDAPGTAFGIADLTHDIVAVLDALAITSAHFVGHSFGGAELSDIATAYPDRIRKMVFLDGGWDFHESFNAERWFDDWPNIPLDVRDRASPQAVAAYLARVWGVTFPLPEIIASHEFDSEGKLVALYPNIGNMFRDFIKPTLKPLDYRRLTQPTLVIRSVPTSVEHFFGGYASYDLVNRQRADAAFEKWKRVVIPTTDRFVKHVAGVQELRIEGGANLVVNAHTGKMLPTMREFLLK